MPMDDMKQGNTYIVWDTNYNDVYQKIQPLLDSGYKCCLLTRTVPEALGELHQNLTVVRFSDDEAKDSIPLTPEHIMNQFETFIKSKTETRVVVLDVFDSLIAFDGKRFTLAYLVLNQMIDLAAITKNILVIPMTSKLLSEGEKNLVLGTPVKEMEVDNHKRPRSWLFWKDRKRIVGHH